MPHEQIEDSYHEDPLEGADSEPSITPRVRFCWLCGNKLRGNYHVEKVIDGHSRVMHKSCANGETTPFNYEAMKECGVKRKSDME